MFQSKLPLPYWTNCILTATHLINCTSSSILNNQTPYHLLFRKPPTYNYFKVFGCLGFAITITSNRGKFQSRATKYIFLGYPLCTKRYKGPWLTNSQNLCFLKCSFLLIYISIYSRHNSYTFCVSRFFSNLWFHLLYPS
jgi:hypothetical protein